MIHLHWGVRFCTSMLISQNHEYNLNRMNEQWIFGLSASSKLTLVVLQAAGRQIPNTLRYSYTPRLGQIQFFWNNPTTEYDSIRLEYQEVKLYLVRQNIFCMCIV